MNSQFGTLMQGEACDRFGIESGPCLGLGTRYNEVGDLGKSAQRRAMPIMVTATMKLKAREARKPVV